MGKTKDDSDVIPKKKRDLSMPQKMKDLPPDDPLKRHESLKLDIEEGSQGKKIAELRRAALEQARKMPKSEEK